MNRVIDLSKIGTGIKTMSRSGGMCLETCRVVTDCFGCFNACYVCYAGGVGC